MANTASSELSNRLRVRVCGIVVSDESVLLVHMKSPTRLEPIWTPPGGGLMFGETLRDGVVREVLEETNLMVNPVHIMYTSEFIKAPYHAVEYYWYCELVGGDLTLGLDPEFAPDQQFIQAVAFISLGLLADHAVFPEYLRDHLQEDVKNPHHQTTHFSQIY